MTRRKFIQAIIRASSAFIIFGGWLAKKVVPRRFTRAVPSKKYPGILVEPKVNRQPGKWSG